MKQSLDAPQNFLHSVEGLSIPPSPNLASSGYGLSIPSLSPDPDYSELGLSGPSAIHDPASSGYRGLSIPPSPNPAYSGLDIPPPSPNLVYTGLDIPPPSSDLVDSYLGFAILSPCPGYSGFSNEELGLAEPSKVLTTRLRTDTSMFIYQMWYIGGREVQISMRKEIDLYTREITLHLWLLGTATLMIKPYGIYQLSGQNQWVRIDGLEDSENIDATLVQSISITF
jgi:hypothetical protein